MSSDIDWYNNKANVRFGMKCDVHKPIIKVGCSFYAKTAIIKLNTILNSMKYTVTQNYLDVIEMFSILENLINP